VSRLNPKGSFMWILGEEFPHNVRLVWLIVAIVIGCWFLS